MGEGPADRMVLVGAVAGAFGVRGEVRLKSFCADPAAIAAYAPLADEAGRSYTLTLSRPVKGGFAAWLGGVGDREAAEALKGTRLYAPRDRLPAPGEDEFYHADLVGLAVVDPGGAPLGRIRAIHDHGAGDVLEILGERGEILMPFTRAAVPTVDLAAGRVVADPPPGLLEAPRDAATGARVAAVAHILREVWDPSGARAPGEPDREHDAHAAEIAALLADGAAAAEIDAYLAKLEVEVIGASRPGPRAEAARRIAVLGRGGGSGR